MLINPYSYAFGTTPFHPAAEDHQPLLDPPKLAYDVRHVPYSSLNVLDLGGTQERRYKTRVRVDPDLVAEWEALLGSTAALQIAGVAYPSATMVDCSSHTMTPHGEFHYYDCEWIVGS